MDAPQTAVPQTLRFGPLTLDAHAARSTPYFLSGRKLYAIGATDGSITPVGDEHLVGEMGGVWAHPIKFLDGWFFSLQDGDGRHDLLRCIHFEGHLSDATLRFEHGPLELTRTDFVADDDAALFSLVEITNTGAAPWSGSAGFVVEINIQPTWFGGWETGGVELLQSNGRAVAFDKQWPDRWGVAFGSSTMPQAVVFGKRRNTPTAELRYELSLAPGQRVELEFLVACEHQNGYQVALQLFDKLGGRGGELLAAKRERYRRAVWENVSLQTPDERINDEWALAKANLVMLEADYSPYVPSYLLAGIPEYPNLFGCDNTYTAPGAAAAGFAPIVRSSLALLGDYARRACGRVPHEITTNGRIFNPGNTQETPQFAIAVWDYFRWTGDTAFLRSLYPVCREGVSEYLPGAWNSDQDGYPQGDAMVERQGMGSRKLDSACYLYAAWRALGEMARVLERPEAAEYDRLAGDWLRRFERDWWIEEQGLYADSLHTDFTPQLDGHWTQVVPVQLGISSPERAELVLAAIESSYTNRWGIMHTRGVDERVWTLPTGLLVLALLRHGKADSALRYLNNIALTTRHGMLGAFKELIPEGICFMQLWSAGLYLQALLEGFLGLDPRAHEHVLGICPTLPPSWPEVQVRSLRVGAHLLNLRVAHDGCTIEHVSGPQALRLQIRFRGTKVAATTATGDVPDAVEAGADGIRIVVDAGCIAELRLDGNRATVHYSDRPRVAGSEKG